MRTPHQGHELDADETLKDINKKTGRNMPQAVATAVMLIALILVCLLVRVDLFVVLIVVFMMLGLWELHVDFAVVGLHTPLLTLCICSAATLLATYYAPRHMFAVALGIMVSLIAVVISASLDVVTGERLAVAVAKKDRHPDAQMTSFVEGNTGTRLRYDNVAVSIFTVLYITLLASFLIVPLTFHGHPVAHAIIVVFLPAISDTGGLFAGAWFGRHKLSPRISPKKSVEGLIGSILASIAGSYVICAITYRDLWATHWWVPIVMGVVVGVIGTFGDLCASMLKRDIGIKDMGHLLKGHGGVLDRVDSILLCAPFLTLLLWVTGL